MLVFPNKGICLYMGVGDTFTEARVVESKPECLLQNLQPALDEAWSEKQNTFLWSWIFHFLCTYNR